MKLARKGKGDTVVKNFVYLAVMPFVAMMLIGAFSNVVRAETATIWTDKADYTPGETVTIFGTGFNALANVSITIERPDGTNNALFAVTDDVGNFTCTYQLDGMEGTYTVTATDGTNTATTTFTDASLLLLWADSGSYVGSNPDEWIVNSWVVSDVMSPGSSISFDLYIDAIALVPGQGQTYNVYLAIAVNDTAQIAGITVGSTTITTFTYGVAAFPPAAGGGTFPLHGVYPTWYALAAFGDVASSYGFYAAPYFSHFAYRAHISVTITTSITMNAGFKVHFDAQGVLLGGSVNINPGNRDLTFQGALSPQYYLTVISPYGTPSGEGWYCTGSDAYAALGTDVVSDGPGVRYVFTGWSGDASGTGLTSKAILMNGPKTAVANWKTQYLVTFLQTGLDGSASGTVVTITIEDGSPLSKDYGNLPFSIWVDSGTSISYAYTSPVPSASGKQFWLSNVTGPTSPFIVSTSIMVTGNYLLLPYSQVTTSKLCYLDTNPSITGQQFRLIFTQDISNPRTYKLTASNPGQFYYNVFYIGTPGSTVTLTITLPTPFTTQGAVPIHVYGHVNIVSGCFVPSDELNGFSVSGTSTITVSGQVPGSGLVYVTVHVDYDLKGTLGYTKNTKNDALVGGMVTIPNLGLYTFSVSGAISDSQAIQNENIFKRDPGFAGLITDSQGNPLKSVKVQIYSPTGKLLATVYTDEDGFYSYAYKHTGKTATFTVKLPDYNLAKSVTVRANSLAEVNFNI